MGLLIKKLKKYLSPKGTLNREEYAVSLVVFLAIAYPFASQKIIDIYFSIVSQFINFAAEPDEFDRVWKNAEVGLYIVGGFFVILLLLIVFCILFNSIKSKIQFLEIKYGELLIFNQNLPHGNITNTEIETRWSMNCRFKSIFSPYGDKKLGEFFKPITLKAASKIGMEYKFPEVK